MIFCYWHDAEREPIRETVDAWRVHFPDFRVIGDSDIDSLIARDFPAHVEAYRKIRIPACKSDIARLVALHEWGGLYVDCHCAVRVAKPIDRLLQRLETFELMVFDEDLNYRPDDPTRPKKPLNSVMFARKNSEIIFEWAKTAFRNLASHWSIEKERGFHPYRIWNMTGAGILRGMILDSDQRALKACFAQRVKIIPRELSPVATHVYHSYSQPGMHWHERQVRELLFD